MREFILETYTDDEAETCIRHKMQEVVRCMDCKHATLTADEKFCKYCEMDTDDFGSLRGVYRDAVWFCADGERREYDA